MSPVGSSHIPSGPTPVLARFLSIPVFLALAATLLVLHPSSVEGQTVRGGGYFAVGAMDLDLDALNQRLTGAGYPEMSSSALTLGGGGHAVRGRLLIGGQGHGFLADDETTVDGNTGVRLGGGYGLFNLGWEVVGRDRLSIYPTAGLGGGGVALQIGPRDVPLFDEVLDDPARNVTLSHAGLLTSLGVRAEVALGDRPRRRAPRQGMVVGMELSVLQSVGNWRWSTEWGEVTRGPDAALDGVHLRVTIGGGGGRR
ncbi:MAG: hypothetical protein EA422_02780 [Gemmatimonadales bacterium]|nr:MAG: hypothetical protein EA422_02780 [Gemmatimonadales bacterium]